MGRMLVGTIRFQFDLDENPYLEIYEPEATDKEKIEYFRETMADNLVAMSEGDGSLLRNFIEMEIVE